MNTRQKGILALFILSAIWASFGLPIRFLAPHFTFWQQIYLRMGVAVVGGFLFFWKDLNFHKLRTLSKRDWLVTIFRVICMYGFAVTLYTQAFTLTTFGDVSLLGAIPTTAVLGFILLREKVTKGKIFFILLSVMGVLLITVKDFSHVMMWNKGDILALVSDFFFSLSYIGRRWQSDALNNKEIAVLMLSLGMILMCGLSFFSGEPLPVASQFSVAIIAVIIVTGLLNIASLFLLNFGFASVEASLASNIVSLESFWAVIFGYVFYKEFLSLQAFLGGALILASVVFLNKEEEKK